MVENIALQNLLQCTEKGVRFIKEAQEVSVDKTDCANALKYDSVTFSETATDSFAAIVDAQFGITP